MNYRSGSKSSSQKMYLHSACLLIGQVLVTMLYKYNFKLFLQIISTFYNIKIQDILVTNLIYIKKCLNPNA